MLPDEIKHEHKMNAFCKNKTCLFLLDLFIAATKGNQKTGWLFIPILHSSCKIAVQLPYWTAGHKPAFCAVRVRSMPYTKTIRLGKSAHPDPLLGLAPLCLCIFSSFWIFRHDYTSSIILKRILDQSRWKYLICSLNDNSGSLLLKVARGEKGKEVWKN